MASNTKEITKEIGLKNNDNSSNTWLGWLFFIILIAISEILSITA